VIGREYYKDGVLLFKLPDGETFQVCSNKKLDMGLHIAKFNYTKTSGEKLTYEWSFSLTQE